MDRVTSFAERRAPIPFVDLAAQYRTIAADIDRAIAQVIQGTDFILGRDVALLEEELASYCQAKYAVAVDSGTSALELILRALEIGPGDEVVTAANSFIASALAISSVGATPVLADADPVTHTINPDQVRQAITRRTKAILPVHLYGQPADMDPLRELAERHGLALVEDACQAHGARYKGRSAGSLGHAAAFSFYPGKNLGGYGDGGMVVTNDSRLAHSVRLLRNYGQREKYHHSVRGFNRRLDTIQAAILRVKLRSLDDWNGARRRHALAYNQGLAGSTVITPATADYAEHAWHLYVIRSSHRDALQAHLSARGIQSGIHYPIPIHLQEAYRDLGYRSGQFPVSEQYATQVLSLPMYAELTTSCISRVVEALREFATDHKGTALRAQAGAF